MGSACKDDDDNANDDDDDDYDDDDDCDHDYDDCGYDDTAETVKTDKKEADVEKSATGTFPYTSHCFLELLLNCYYIFLIIINVI